MRTSSGTVSINYLFDSAGRWIAFRKRRYVFDRDSRWIGWTPWDDNEVYSPNGSYLGTITYGNRLYCYLQRDDRGAPGTIEPPPFPGTYSEPTSPGRAVLLPWAHDLDFSWHAELDWSSDLGSGIEQNMIFGHQPDIRSLRNPTLTHINENKLPALDLDTEISSLGEGSEKSEIKTPSKPREAYRDDDREERRMRSRSRYDDDDYDDERDYRSRPRSRYDDDDYDDDRNYRSRPRSRYDDDYDDDRSYRSRPRNRYEDDYDDERSYRSRPRSRYEDDYDDDRNYRSRPRSRYEDDYDDERGYRSRPRSRYDDDYEDERGYRSRPRSRYDDDYDDERSYRPPARSRYDDDEDTRDRRSRVSSRHSDDDYDDRYQHRPQPKSRKDEEEDELLSRKKEMDRLRLVISKHAAKRADMHEDDITLLQPLKKSN